jgi:transcription elongation factor GreB
VSRAFVKEGDGPEVLARPEPVLPEGARNHITPAGAAAFHRRLAEAQAERGALGESGLDVSRKAELDAEIRWLERRIATFVVTEPPPHPVRVGFGTVMTLENDGGRRVVRIVGVDEADPASGAISWISPLARVLHGAEVGDQVTVDTPGGTEDWEVVAIESLAGSGAGEPPGR